MSAADLVRSVAGRVSGLGARRITILGVAVVASLAVLAWAVGRERANGKTSYATESVDRGPIAVEVTATGTVNPVTTVQVGTYVSGPIKEIFVDFNSPVTKGQLVATIDPRPFQVKVQQAEANVANAQARAQKSRADLALKKLTMERNRELRGRNLISQNDLDTARSDYDQAVAQLALDEASVKQAEAAAAEARINLGYTQIQSPVDGVVVSRSVDVGQTVAASFQTPTLFQIAQDLTKMQVDSNVSESDIGGVREGQPVAFTVDAYPGRVFEGKVVQVRNAPIAVQNVVTYDVVVGVANPDFALKPGMTATVTITTARRDDVLRVPLRALRFRPENVTTGDGGEGAKAEGAGGAGAQRGGGQASGDGGKRKDAAESAVYVLDGNTPRRVEVKTGLRNERFAEVQDGSLAVGDAVVVSAKRSEPKPAAPTGSPLVPQPPRRR